ncbi:facilitated trehalose transporter Tret1-like [Pectinophora gossypiella]|uniref:facilitated trehalose transporter Tret1-like n=1 Tax=Pectinophora gossypiella TaxID=13191 RepID=UPI00214EC811|nr:facilitated trehalose transporter Tret1-like [Pectinophora gossypiella]
MLGICASPMMRQYAAVIIVNLSVVCMGLNTAWPSPVLVKLRNETQSVLPRPITDEEGSWVVSAGFLAAALSCSLPAYLVDRIGRKYSAILVCLPRLLVCLLFTLASRVWMLILGRIIGDVTDMLTVTVVPMYATEIASVQFRGSLGTILQVSSSLGVLIMLSMGPFISYLTLNIIFTCVTIMSTIPVFYLPDSPYFLYSEGRTAEALKVLTYFRGSEELAKEEIKEYALSSSTPEVKISKRELFTNKVFLKTVGIVIVLGIGAQMSGFSAVSFYLQTVLESTHTDIKPEVASVIIGFIQLTASFCTASITDRFGRKLILTVTVMAIALGMVGLGAFFQLRESFGAVSGVMHYVPIVSIVFVVFGYSAGPGSLFWVLMTELFEGPARAVGVFCGLSIFVLFAFISTKFFPTVTLALGPAITYWSFGVICLLYCLFVVFCLPETKGKSILEIQVALGKADDVVKERDEKC